jgi:CubicO group peptidase (beta-lactamase class C family)
MRRFIRHCLTHPSVRKLAVGLLTPAMAVACATAQHAPAATEQFPIELDRYIAKVLTDWQIPGLAIAVVRNDSTLVAKR